MYIENVVWTCTIKLYERILLLFYIKKQQHTNKSKINIWNKIDFCKQVSFVGWNTTRNFNVAQTIDKKRQV